VAEQGHGAQSPTMRRETYSLMPKTSKDSHPADGIKRKIKGIFEDPPKVGSKEEKNGGTQEWWTTAVNRLREKGLQSTCRLVDAHVAPSVGTRKPDLVAYKANEPQNSTQIVFFGDVKPRGTAEDFTDDQKGHLMELAMSLFREQPFRLNSVHCFLSDGYIIQFFQVIRKDGKFTNITHRVQVLNGPGGVRLLNMLHASPAQLGHSLPVVMVSGVPIHLKTMLGQGGSSFVFQGKLKSNMCVVKCFFDSRRGDVAIEQENLKTLATAVKKTKEKNKYTQTVGVQFPKFHHVSDDGLSLLLTPIGKKFVTAAVSASGSDDCFLPSADHFCHLIDNLEFVHQRCGLVHRDIAMHNFFDMNGGVLLNDFGCAVNQGDACLFEGALRHAPGRVLHLEADETYQPQFSDDLVMVVRCVFERLFPDLFLAIAHLTVSESKEIAAFWTTSMEPELFVNMMEVAEKCDYRGLKEIIVRVIPKNTSNKKNNKRSLEESSSSLSNASSTSASTSSEKAAKKLKVGASAASKRSEKAANKRKATGASSSSSKTGKKKIEKKQKASSSSSSK
jgi:tRNA A-37 threonylcarbamoyl transferase component Bud32